MMNADSSDEEFEIYFRKPPELPPDKGQSSASARLANPTITNLIRFQAKDVLPDVTLEIDSPTKQSPKNEVQVDVEDSTSLPEESSSISGNNSI